MAYVLLVGWTTSEPRPPGLTLGSRAETALRTAAQATGRDVQCVTDTDAALALVGRQGFPAAVLEYRDAAAVRRPSLCIALKRDPRTARVPVFGASLNPLVEYLAPWDNFSGPDHLLRDLEQLPARSLEARGDPHPVHFPFTARPADLPLLASLRAQRHAIHNVDGRLFLGAARAPFARTFDHFHDACRPFFVRLIDVRGLLVPRPHLFPGPSAVRYAVRHDLPALLESSLAERDSASILRCYYGDRRHACICVLVFLTSSVRMAVPVAELL